MNTNRFYNEFDQNCYADDYNSPRKSDHRGVFAQDRDRILFTNSFRRLQAKTQVFQAGEYDFYRTRLTHSLEVSTIAKSISGHLLAESEFLKPDFYIDPDLIEAICLAHDIGHPPFGHAGERVLNALMAKYGGFEGNAQSLRILTRTIYGSSRGMSPSRALLDGILKYKRLYRNRGKDQNHFIYDDQVSFLEFCFGRDKVAIDFKSIECQIMDMADDIAYSCCDIVDGVRARFLTLEKILKWQESPDNGLTPGQQEHLQRLIAKIKAGHLDASMSKIIGKLVAACSLRETSNFMKKRSNRYRFELVIDPESRDEIELYKKLSRLFVFGSSALQQIEFKGGQLLRRITTALEGNYIDKRQAKIKLLPQPLHELLNATSSKKIRARLVCDYLSGMTDAYAVRTYKRLFDPDYGSISELL
jgi:dGTPase